MHWLPQLTTASLHEIISVLLSISSYENLQLPSALVGRISIVVFVSLGVLVIWGGVVGGIITWLTLPDRNDRQPSLAVTTDGMPLLAPAKRSQGKLSYLSLSGERVSTVGTFDFLDPAELPFDFKDFSAHKDPAVQRILAVNAGQPPTYWYFLQVGLNVDNGAVLVGYDPVTYNRVGYIGTGGFAATCPRSEETFQIDQHRFGPSQRAVVDFTEYSGHVPIYKRQSLRPLGHVYVLSEDIVYDVDLQQRTVHTLSFGDNKVISIGLGSVRGGLELQDNGKAAVNVSDVSWRLFIRTLSEIIVFDPKSESEFRYAIPTELTNTSFNVYVTDRDRILYVQTDGTDHPTSIATVNASGHIIDRDKIIRRRIDAMNANTAIGWKKVLIAPAPIIQGLFALLNINGSLSTDLQPSNEEFVSTTWNRCLALLITAAASVTAIAVLTRVEEFRHEQRRWVWTIMIFLMGPVTAFVYWFEQCHATSQCSIGEPDTVGTEILI